MNNVNPNNEINETEIILFSKLSIFLVSILTSPIIAVVLYSSNLRQTGQKNKIFGTVISVAFADLLVIVPFFGFSLPFDIHNPIFFINNIGIGLLMISPMWHLHFKDFKFKTKFPWRRVIVLILAFVSFVVFNLWLDNYFVFLEPATDSLIRYHTLMILPIIFVVLFGRLFYDIGKSIFIKIVK